MIKAETVIEVDGKPIRLALPIGALAEIATVNAQLAAVEMGFRTMAWEWPELRAVIAAGLKWGAPHNLPQAMSADELITAIGIGGVDKGGAVDLAAKLMGAWLLSMQPKEAPGKPEAAATT